MCTYTLENIKNGTRVTMTLNCRKTRYMYTRDTRLIRLQACQLTILRSSTIRMRRMVIRSFHNWQLVNRKLVHQSPSPAGVLSTPKPTPLPNFSAKSPYQSTLMPSVKPGSVLRSPPPPPGAPELQKEEKMPVRVTPVDLRSKRKMANLSSTVSSVTVPAAVRLRVPVCTRR